jgi:group II intron reverse transcriptase/maturase
MLSKAGLYEAFKKVKSAKGAAGIDGQTIADFSEKLDESLTILAKELEDKSYEPKPVKRVEIPKPGGKGIRKLGIPSVRDRVVQQALLEIMQPIFDPEFHPSSYGYRPCRSCHQAITKASMFIRTYDLQWVVDMDLSKCFDTLDHEIIIGTIRRKITDGSILKLIRKFLESGVMTDNGWEESEVGSPQGGVISPLIANIYLNEFDQFMKGRGHRIVRYADDILILTRSEKAAKNALEQATRYLEQDLKLTVNRDKTHVTNSNMGVKFLGVVIHTGYTRIQEKKVQGFKEKVRKITRRNSPVNLKQVIMELTPVIRGFANYFRIANCQKVNTELMRWIRRRLRAKQLKLWKKPQKLHRRLRQLGYKGEFKLIKMSSWRNSASPLASYALPNKYFDEIGLFDMAKVQTGISVPVC